MLTRAATILLAALCLLLPTAATSDAQMPAAKGAAAVCSRQGSTIYGAAVPSSATVCNAPSGPPTSCPTVDAYATNAAVTLIPGIGQKPVFPIGTFSLNNVCKRVVLQNPITTLAGMTLGTSFLFKDNADNLYLTVLLDLQPASTGYQYYFSRPSSQQSQQDPTGSFSSAAELLIFNTVPAVGTGLSTTNYKDILPTAVGNYLSWTYKINLKAVCNPNTGSVTGTAACTGGTLDLSNTQHTFMKAQFNVARYPLAASAGQPGPNGPSCGSIDNSTIVTVALRLAFLSGLPVGCSSQQQSPSMPPPSPPRRPPPPPPRKLRPSPPPPPPPAPATFYAIIYINSTNAGKVLSSEDGVTVSNALAPYDVSSHGLQSEVFWSASSPAAGWSVLVVKLAFDTKAGAQFVRQSINSLPSNNFWAPLFSLLGLGCNPSAMYYNIDASAAGPGFNSAQNSFYVNAGPAGSHLAAQSYTLLTLPSSTVLPVQLAVPGYACPPSG